MRLLCSTVPRLIKWYSLVCRIFSRLIVHGQSRPSSTHGFNNTAANVLEELNNHRPLGGDTDILRTINRRFEVSLSKLQAPLQAIEVALKWLEKTIAEVAARSKIDISEELASRYSREGGLLRLWIRTLPEMALGLVGTRSAYTEWYVERLLDTGVEDDIYWSALVELSGEKADTPT
jgi:hypothetical protein